MNEKLHTLITLLLAFQSDPDWWPGSSVFDIAVSAVLTQNTSWNNVSKAMERLKESGINNWERILESKDLETVPGLLECSAGDGYVNVEGIVKNNILYVAKQYRTAGVCL